jgi:hypothetical protein
MDEIEVIRAAFGAAERDPEARERARVGLRNAMAAERPVVLTRPTPVPAAPVAPAVRPSRPILRPARWLGAAAAIVAAVLVAQTVFTQHQGGPTPDSLARAHSHAAAVAALENLAAAAPTSQPGAIPRGKFAFFSSQLTEVDAKKGESDQGNQNVGTGASYNLSVESSVQTWIRPDGSGERLTTITGYAFVTEKDRQTWLSMDRRPALPLIGTFDDEEISSGEATFGLDLSTLPTDPSALESALRKPTSGPPGLFGDATVMEHISYLLSDCAPSPALRAALFKVLEAMPGIRFLGQVQDPLDRPGVGFVLPLGTTEREIIVDQSTSDVLASLKYLPAVGGTLRSSTVYLPSTIVSRPHVAT